ncbi:MAG: MFS transporter [Chloroflexia bacterium]|nr:MFS transporter [Chloroflexia bacterium]
MTQRGLLTMTDTAPKASRPTFDRDFLKLWVAVSGSLAGTQITGLAIPLIAAVSVGASPFQMGMLAAASQAAYLVVSVPAGLFLNRIRRRPVMIVTDLGCALLLLSIPIASVVGQVGFLQLCVVAAGVGLLGATGEIAHMAYLPSLVSRERLVSANSKIQVSHSVAESAGPGVGGLLVQVLSAPLAILTDALSYLVSACLISRIEQEERAPGQPATGSLRQSVTEGFGVLTRHPLLRPIVWTSMASTLFGSGLMALYILYASRDLELSPVVIGLTFAIGGVCAVPGALLANRAGRRVGVGQAILWGWIIEAGAWLLIPLAAGPTGWVVLVLAASRALEGFTGTIANIHQWTLRQAVTPDRLQGRVTASHRFLVYGSGAVGALLGGALGSVMDLRMAILLCAAGAVLARVTALFSPLGTLHDQPLCAVET